MIKVVVFCLILGAVGDRYGEAVMDYLLQKAGYHHISGMFIDFSAPPEQVVSLPFCHSSGYKIDICPSNGE
jgi:hypothetical protein